MGEHYYSNSPSSSSNPSSFRFPLRNEQFLFHTDSGVFSKKEVDFGSRLLIESFYENEELEGNILDVGCGYGPIGISMAKSFPKRNVEMIDVNERAIALAKKNASENGVSNVQIHMSNIYESVPKENKYAYIFSNPPIRAGKQVVHTILEEAKSYLLPDGELWIVIQKKQGAPSALEKLEALFGEVEVVEKKKGYYIIKSKNS